MRKRQIYHSFIAALYILIQSAMPAYSSITDTIKVNQSGENNKVILNSRQLEDSCLDIPGAPVQGEIRQVGENNNVVIVTNPKEQAPKNKRQIANSKQQLSNDKTTKATSKEQKANSKILNTNSKTQNTNNNIQITGDQSSGTSKNNISIIQTGSNNSVKINQQ